MMVNRSVYFYLCIVCILMAVLASAGACAPRPQTASIKDGIRGEDPVFVPSSLLALVKSGEAPLWFEFTDAGPANIPGPAEASGEPFTPWPQARYTAGFAVDGEGRLIMAVNRDGFLAWEIRKDGLGLYRVAEQENAWGPYTASALFMYRNTPVVLLHRDDFFPHSGDETPILPAVRAWGLRTDLLAMEEIEIPAFSALPQVEGWNLDDLSLGRDGLWYFRAVRGGSSPEIRYFRTRDLEFPGEPSSAGVFRKAMKPYAGNDIPPPLRAALEEAEHSAGNGKTLVAAVVSPEFPARRYFSLQSEVSGEGEILELAGFYRPPDTAALVFPGGRGILAGPSPATETFTLPYLPQGFVYTRIGFAGPVLIASWEEQQDWRIGAAGFMVINAPENREFE